jgi:hypothetical protein
MFSSGVVALAGSRALPLGGASVVGYVVQSLRSSGCSLVVGCCTGADEVVLRTVPPASIQVMCAFGPGGRGSCQRSAVSAIDNHFQSYGSVTWWAGGGPLVPLRVRLARRTKAVVSAATAGLVVFPTSPSARGSWLAARLAVGRGLPVVVFPLFFSPSLLPPLGNGKWVRAGSGMWSLGWRWMPC